MQAQAAFLAHLLTSVLLSLHKLNQVRKEHRAGENAIMMKRACCCEDSLSHQERLSVRFMSPRTCPHVLKPLILKYVIKKKKLTEKNISNEI